MDLFFAGLVPSVRGPELRRNKQAGRAHHRAQRSAQRSAARAPAAGGRPVG